MESFTKEHYIGTGAIRAREKKIGGDYNTHRHEFYEIEYIVSGSGEYRINDQCYDIHSGMLFFMTPFDFHSVSTPECHVYNIMFSEELCDTDFLIRLLHGTHAPAWNTCGSDADFWRSSLREITTANPNTSYVYMVYLLNAVLGKLAIRQADSHEVGTPVKTAMLYLLHHFRDNPTLSETAAHVGYTPSYFSAIFKEETGVGFKEYLDRLRFDYAKKLLRHSKFSVSQICRECGFEDYPNFIRRFKKRFGFSPTKLT